MVLSFLVVIIVVVTPILMMPTMFLDKIMIPLSWLVTKVKQMTGKGSLTFKGHQKFYFNKDYVHYAAEEEMKLKEVIEEVQTMAIARRTGGFPANATHRANEWVTKVSHPHSHRHYR